MMFHLLLLLTSLVSTRGYLRLKRDVTDPKVNKVNTSSELFPGILLADGYDMYTRPTLGDPSVPLNVTFSMYLGGILAIDEPTQSISIEANLRASWRDDRISHNITDVASVNRERRKYKLINRAPIDTIWFPDMYIDKAKAIDVPNYKVPPEFLRIYPDGTLLYSQKVIFALSCSMDFSDYPVDTQECDVILESWGSETDEVLYFWDQGLNKINKKITLNQQYLQVKFLGNDIVATPDYATGKYFSHR